MFVCVRVCMCARLCTHMHRLTHTHGFLLYSFTLRKPAYLSIWFQARGSSKMTPRQSKPPPHHQHREDDVTNARIPVPSLLGFHGGWVFTNFNTEILVHYSCATMDGHDAGKVRSDVRGARAFLAALQGPRNNTAKFAAPHLDVGIWRHVPFS